MKKFLIIGSANAITYKEIFPYIASGEWFIRTANGKISFVMYFTNSEGEIKKVPSVWFTNLDSRHLYKTLELTKTYDPEKYPRYDNYNAVEVGCIKDIPYDYEGIMGVPISIVLFSPYQFEIVGCSRHDDMNMDGGVWLGGKADATINGKEVYKRILIKKK